MSNEERIDAQLDELMKIEDKTRFSSQLGDVLAMLIEHNYPYIPVIAQHIRDTEDGVVQCELKVYKGKVQHAVFHNLTKVKFEK